jgi:hypothetical protein
LLIVYDHQIISLAYKLVHFLQELNEPLPGCHQRRGFPLESFGRLVRRVKEIATHCRGSSSRLAPFAVRAALKDAIILWKVLSADYVFGSHAAVRAGNSGSHGRCHIHLERASFDLFEADLTKSVSATQDPWHFLDLIILAKAY